MDMRAVELSADALRRYGNPVAERDKWEQINAVRKMYWIYRAMAVLEAYEEALPTTHTTSRTNTQPAQKSA